MMDPWFVLRYNGYYKIGGMFYYEKIYWIDYRRFFWQ